METLENQNLNSKFFIINRSNLLDRLDTQFYRESFDFTGFIKLSKIATVKGGKRIPLGLDYSNSETDFLYLRVADMNKDNDLDFTTLNFISAEVYEILKRYEIIENDLTISIAGTIGKILLLKNIPKNKKIILTENCAKINIKNDIEVLPNYLELILNLPIVQKQIQLNYIQTTIPKLGLDRVKNLMLPQFPNKVKQNEIILFYNKILTQKQQKEEKAQVLLKSIDTYLLNELGIILPEKDNSLNSRMFTVNFSEVIGSRFDGYYYQKDFIEFFDSLKNSKYPVLTLKQISKKITSGITPLSGGDSYTTSLEGIPFVRSGNINIDGELDFDDLLYLKTEIHNTTMKSSKLLKNDLMIAIVGATIGQVGIYLDDREANINQAIALIRLKDEKIYNPFFIKEVAKSSIGQYNLNRLKRPVARANINLEEISTMQLIVPPIEIQNKIMIEIQEIRNQAKQLKADAKKILEEAKQEVEKMIIG